MTDNSFDAHFQKCCEDPEFVREYKVLLDERVEALDWALEFASSKISRLRKPKLRGFARFEHVAEMKKLYVKKGANYAKRMSPAERHWIGRLTSKKITE